MLSIYKTKGGKYIVEMIKSEEVGEKWLKTSDFTARILLRMKRDKQVQPGESFKLINIDSLVFFRQRISSNWAHDRQKRF